MIFIKTIFYIKSKLRKINENSHQTKIEFVCVVIDENNLLCYKRIDRVIDENDSNNFCRLYHVTNSAYYSHQVNHFKFDELITRFCFVKHAI